MDIHITLIILILLSVIVIVTIILDHKESVSVSNYIRSLMKELYDRLDEPSFTEDQLDKSLSLFKKELMFRFKDKKVGDFKYIDESFSIDPLDTFLANIRQDFLSKRKAFPQFIETKFENTNIFNLLVNF
jgi:hypothetical protein